MEPPKQEVTSAAQVRMKCLLMVIGMRIRSAMASIFQTYFGSGFWAECESGDDARWRRRMTARGKSRWHPTSSGNFEGFFAKDMLGGAEGGDGGLAMRTARHDDADGVHGTAIPKANPA